MQQINLYHASLRKQILRFSAQRLLQGSLVLSILLVLWHAVNVFQLYNLQSHLNTNNTLLAEKKNQLLTLQASLPKVKKDDNLDTTLKKLELDLINKQAVLSVLSERKLGNTNGFTKHFESLARQTIEGLWLTKLHFMQGGTVLDFQGQSVRPELVPQYLQALSSEAAFKGTEFDSFILQREKANKSKKYNALSFKINNIEAIKAAPQAGLSSQ